MAVVSESELRSIIAEVLAGIAAPASPDRVAPAAPVTPTPTAPAAPVAPAARPRPAASVPGPTGAPGEVHIEVSDPTVAAERRRIGVANPVNATGLANLAASTSARLAVGRAGPRPPTRATLLFGADHAVTQDAIFGDVPTDLLEQFGLFTVQTRVTTQDEFLLRPDLGRLLSDEAKEVVAQRCTKKRSSSATGSRRRPSRTTCRTSTPSSNRACGGRGSPWGRRSSSATAGSGS